MRVKFTFFFCIFIMETIIEPNSSFDFTKIYLANPIAIQGGQSFFTKLEYNKKPLYIQTTKSQTRQGFVKSGKKYYCDLMFDKTSEDIIQWFETLEETCQKFIYERRNTWFNSPLELSDIETAFNSTIRVYKSGKFYLLRTNIKNDHQNQPSIKIYNEKEIPLAMTDITNENNLISILEIQGIKFTSRNFQIEIELKQVMVLDNEPLFDNCLIKTNRPAKSLPTSGSSSQPAVLPTLEEFMIETEPEPEVQNTSSNNDIDVLVEKDLDPEQELELELEHKPELKPLEKDTKPEPIPSIELKIEELEDFDPDFQEMKELPLENTVGGDTNPMQLKKPNQVYFELYKEAKKKAKQAKKNALLAYLEAKNIKKTYMIENINDSDSDFDAEIDDVSESELEGL